MQKSLAMLVLLFLQLCRLRCSKDVDDYIDSKPEKGSPVEVRAVFISCEPDERGSESDATRFERQELFKHNAMQECNKKLALTVKMATENGQSPGDEYIPIEHVFEGVDTRRVRLLNPYVLRLRREPPVQAYKLRRIDTVSGVLTTSDEGKFQGNQKILKRRDTDVLDGVEWAAAAAAAGGAAGVFTLEHDAAGRRSYSVRVDGARRRPPDNYTDTQVSKDCGLRLFSVSPASRSATSQAGRHRAAAAGTVFDGHKHGKHRQKDHSRVKRETCLGNKTLLKRDKRFQQNVKIEGVEYNNSDQENHRPEKLNQDIARDTVHITPHALALDGDSYKEIAFRKTLDNKPSEMKPRLIHSATKDTSHQSGLDPLKPYSKEALYVTEKTETDDDYAQGISNNDFDTYNKQGRNSHDVPKNNQGAVGTDEKDFALYEIGNPSLWFKVHVQLFEKLSTPEGKTVWNDVTKGEQASVSETDPEWVSEDMTLRYRPAEWLARDAFTLPMASLCLLMPVENENADNESTDPEISNEEYIVVPVEDVVGVEDDAGNNLIKRDDSYSDLSAFNASDKVQRRHRRVVVRVSRAVLGDSEGRFGLTTRGAERFLTLAHRRPHRARIDLEARADDNQLVRVGSSGCIATIVADNTRKSRTILTLQATNTGLASARFRVTARECGPVLSGLVGERSEGASAGPVLLPPRLTRRLRLELPIEMPVDIAHCTVALVNDDDESVAVRDVAIKKGDRCFCVWHCDCVCLSEDPKLLCREMSAARQVSAGLPPRARPRHARAACYKDVVSIDLTVVVCGVFVFLLTLGIGKAVLGLRCRCIALLGLCLILQMPRQLDRYYEKCLKCRTVVYDCDGWPVHPDTKKRTVLPVSRQIMFLLNVIYFVVLPFMLMRNACGQVCSRCHTCAQKVKNAYNKSETKNCYSSQDIQSAAAVRAGRRRRRRALRRWMSPQAEQLSGDVWQRDLAPSDAPNEPMRPLLHEPASEDARSACDSEHDDTEYVLTQMQKSRESLARSQKKQNDSVPSVKRENRKEKPMLIK